SAPHHALHPAVEAVAVGIGRHVQRHLGVAAVLVQRAALRGRAKAVAGADAADVAAEGAGRHRALELVEVIAAAGQLAGAAERQVDAQGIALAIAADQQV
ncbi:Uncharacterized protein APZ42_002994, partial [Daphnia magna]